MLLITHCKVDKIACIEFMSTAIYLLDVMDTMSICTMRILFKAVP